jgi:hypothetical protein
MDFLQVFYSKILFVDFRQSTKSNKLISIHRQQYALGRATAKYSTSPTIGGRGENRHAFV